MVVDATLLRVRMPGHHRYLQDIGFPDAERSTRHTASILFGRGFNWLGFRVEREFLIVTHFNGRDAAKRRPWVCSVGNEPNTRYFHAFPLPIVYRVPSKEDIFKTCGIVSD